MWWLTIYTYSMHARPRHGRRQQLLSRDCSEAANAETNYCTFSPHTHTLTHTHTHTHTQAHAEAATPVTFALTSPPQASACQLQRRPIGFSLV
jgi:hypothetical protein